MGLSLGILGKSIKVKDKDKDSFTGLQEFVVGYSKAPEQPQSSARPTCHSHTMTSMGCEPATIRIAAYRSSPHYALRQGRRRGKDVMPFFAQISNQAWLYLLTDWSSAMVGRLSGSFTRHILRKLLNSADHKPFWSSEGTSDFWILMRTRMGCISWLGGSIWASSIRVIPANTQ